MSHAGIRRTPGGSEIRLGGYLLGQFPAPGSRRPYLFLSVPREASAGQSIIDAGPAQLQ
ncbi:hypothetical protein [Pseudomonas aeruginosa]|uniref:Uncharacterized protein n=1 Tax=Pseudomonas aeruginosa TaxID=287 RepID=A0A6A9JVG2_PSEAI|nr:hypothetical protein [Pseudomonas aeruginosa]MUI56822.1 hypothetical protein [Pseudomonas aeruginosa]